jgi:hypothetical protein
MFPRLSLNDAMNSRKRNTIFRRQAFQSIYALGVFAANFDDLFFRKDSGVDTRSAFQSLWMEAGPVAVTFSFSASAFIAHIYAVIFLRSKPQMQRIAANRVVAGMANFQIFRIDSVINFVRDTVREITAVIEPDRSVSNARRQSGPRS